ncbi:MAG: excinuclease ABC subunit C [Ignavibacteria bacterium]|nr:excinuclease ABC subunit C [Ignavibacteria bacterium]
MYAQRKARRFAYVKTQESDISTHIQQKLSTLPTRPGVYLHKDSKGGIIYVGKAKNLRSRVRSYFQENRPVDAKTAVLVRQIQDFDFIVTDTEVEAFILENTLIKQYRPKYNILLKDDKSYPFIRITKEQYPRVFKTRTIVKDGSKYFGPYTDGTYLYHLLKSIRSIFPLRSCDLPLAESGIEEGRWKVCLDYHIKKCDGPCQGYISKDDYNIYIKQIQQVLQGKTRELERQLEERMHRLADEMKYEDALVVRQRLERLREYTSKQRVLSNSDRDQDVFAFVRSERIGCSIVLTIRDGKLVGKRHFLVQGVQDLTDAEVQARTLEQWYIDADHFPDEVIVQYPLQDQEVLQEFLCKQAGRNVSIILPKIGDKRKLIELAEQNADAQLREHMAQQAEKDQSVSRAVLTLQRDLRMESLPRRIECIDNSHMQGTDYVSSVVCFVDGKPRKSDYRHYKLRTLTSNDDFEAMKEVISRRFTPKEPDQEVAYPDLLIIDGGKGQLSHAMEVLDALGLRGKFTVIGLAKRLEEIFTPGSALPLFVAKTSSSLRLLQQVRDEAHRFAIQYHRKLREKRTITTELLTIAGIGKTTATKLLRTYGSVEGVRAASQDSLEQVVGKSTASKLIDYFTSTPPDAHASS